MTVIRGEPLQVERMGFDCSVCGGLVDVAASAGDIQLAKRNHNCASYLIPRILELEFRLANLFPRVVELELRLAKEPKA
jgi:hypothetical protein